MEMRLFKVYLYGFLVLLFVVFIIQNFQTLTQGISLRFNLGFVSLVSVPIPLFLLAAFLFFGGVVLTTLIHWAEKRPLIKEIKFLKKNAPPTASVSQPSSSSATGPADHGLSSGSTKTEGKKSEGGTIVSSKPLVRKDPSGGDNPTLPA